MVNPTMVLDLVERLGSMPRGAVATFDIGSGDAEVVAAWCEHSGNELVNLSGESASVRRGRSENPLAGIAIDQLLGTRLWMYTHFDCNLACDYCCVRASPQTARRALGVDRGAQLAREAVRAGVQELILTGGEPFLLPDIDKVVESCTSQLRTTFLTNGDVVHRSAP
jgi:sulfatase maturation enzyme AslB (radical SAM superfamily)